MDIKQKIINAAYSTYNSSFYILTADNTTNTFQISKLLLDSEIIEKIIKINIHIKENCKKMVFSESGKILGILIGRTLAYMRIDCKTPMVYMHSAETKLISLAISPDDKTIAMGDYIGKLTLLQFSPDFSELPILQSFHWHAHGIETLIFQREGQSIYSGGKEGVLVNWHQNTNKKSFLPRLSESIRELGISIDGTLLAIGLENNSIKIIKYFFY